MKKKLFVIINILLFTQLLAQQSGELYSFLKNDTFITNNKENTQKLAVDFSVLVSLIENKENINFTLPNLEGGFINVNLKSFSIIKPDHQLIIEKQNGKFFEKFKPSFASYYIYYQNKSIGTLILFKDYFIVSYSYNNKQLEINKINNNYFLFDVNDCVFDKSFTCEVKEKRENLNFDSNIESSESTPKCLQLAIELDNYTRNLYNSNSSATNWAHAIIAGASQVYASDVSLNIEITTTIIWETTDPYASYVNQAGSMLSALRNHWISNNSNIVRDLVHLMTRRTNTGTGGIAYRDVLCSNNWGYAFSANLNNNTNFNFPNPSYTWNLLVITHEIGHNIESHHTHWCGWPGGPIDNCVDVEGSCSNNPNPQVGTIMSYCHTTSSGSLIDFHPTVINSALNPGINGASCLTTCDFYGCTDPNATNYDPNATVDDGSCTYSNPILSASITNVSCNGGIDGSINLSVSGGLLPFSYVWSNGAFSEDIFSLQAGTYSVTVTDALGQSTSASYTINEPNIMNTIYTITNTSGFGMSDGSIVASVSGGTPT